MSLNNARSTSNSHQYSSKYTAATLETSSSESNLDRTSQDIESYSSQQEEISSEESGDETDESSDSHLELIQYKLTHKLLKPFKKIRLKNRKFWPQISRKLKKDLETGHHGNRMVLEPKFTDYGSIHSADIPQLQQQHITSHPLLTQITPRSVLLPQLEEESKTSKGKNMTQGDLYQRQPLLSNTGRNDNRTTDYYIDEDEEQILHQSSASNGGHRAVEISIPTPIREEPRFPQERCKTVLAFLVCIFSFILTLLALAIIHDKVPDRETYGPLPDVILDNVPVQNWALDVSEYIIIVSVNLMLLCMLFHRHRFIVFRRLFLILSLLYMYRAITMFVTVMPISNKSYYCSPKLNHTTPLVIVQRIATLFSGLGLSVNGKHVFCGDYIYSGHTVILIFSYLFMSEYTPKKLYLLHWLYAAFALVGVAMVQLSHGHYTVDVVIAYYITTRIFWIYHTLANNTSLKQHSPNNYLGRSWWFTFFLYFERNVNHPVPRQWPDWPLPWPRRFLTKSRES